MTWPKQKNPVM